jgi:hypothetical protein
VLRAKSQEFFNFAKKKNCIGTMFYVLFLALCEEASEMKHYSVIINKYCIEGQYKKFRVG